MKVWCSSCCRNLGGKLLIFTSICWIIPAALVSQEKKGLLCSSVTISTVCSEEIGLEGKAKGQVTS